MAELAGNLLKFLFASGGDYDKKLKKEQLKQLRENKAQSFRAGHVNAKKLLKSGEDITYAKYAMSEKQLKDMAYHAKQRGITMSWIKNGHDKGTYIAIYKTKDSAVIEDITAQLIRDSKIEAAEQAMDGAKDSELRDEFGKAKEKAIREDIDTFNDKQSEALFSKMCDAKEAQSRTFNDTIDRFQSNGWKKEEPYYICKRTDPGNYMEVISDQAEFRGQEYTKHTYNIYVNDQLVGNSAREDQQWTDERFEGRPKAFWTQMKSQMKEAGNFGDDLVVFYSKEELLEYRKAFEIQKNAAKESTIAYEADGQSFQNDYAGIVNNLKSQLKKFEDLGTYENGMFTVHTSDNLTKLPDLKDPRFVEAYVISRQISTFEKMGSLSNDIASAKLQMQINEKSELKGSETYSRMQDDLSKKIDDMERQMKEYEKTVRELSQDREQIAGVNAERIVTGRDDVAEDAHGEERITMEQLKDDVSRERTEKATATPDKGQSKEHQKTREDKER